jgi:hypothetical protein
MKILTVVAMLACLCSTRCDRYLCDSQPEPFRLKVVSFDGMDFLSSLNFEQIKLYYTTGSAKVDIPFALKSQQISPSENYVVIESAELPFESSQGHSKVFLLELSNSDIDTLNIDVQRNSSKCISYSYNQVEFNGAVCEIDKSTTIWVYVAKK